MAGGWSGVPKTLDFLGSAFLTGAANSTSIITIAPREFLWIAAVITGYTGGGGIGSLRFGGTAGAVDSGNTYNTRFIRWAAGSNNNTTDVPTTTTDRLRLGSQAINLSRSVFVQMSNIAGTNKMAFIGSASEAGAVGTAPTLDGPAQGMWANTTQQIISVQLIATANNMLTGSGIAVYGGSLV